MWQGEVFAISDCLVWLGLLAVTPPHRSRGVGGSQEGGGVPGGGGGVWNNIRGGHKSTLLLYHCKGFNLSIVCLEKKQHAS